MDLSMDLYICFLLVSLHVSNEIIFKITTKAQAKKSENFWNILEPLA